MPKVMLHKVGFSLPYIGLANSEIRAAVTVCVAALAILDRLEEIDQPTLCWWLSERQLPNGGLNGRPEKLEDVSSLSQLQVRHIFNDSIKTCYSYWVLSALSILGKLSWIDADKLTSFILSAQVCQYLLQNLSSVNALSNQETENGGIADRPGDVPDVFHTHFGVAGEHVYVYVSLALV